MARKLYSFSDESLGRLLAELPGKACYITQDKPAGSDYGSWEGLDTPTSLRGKRPTSPIKAFLIPPRERVASYWTEEEAPFQPQQFSLVGLRNCDLLALKYLDQVFLGGVCEDPFYKARREAAFLVSVDCLAPQDTCFCTRVGGRPYATAGFDINLVPMNSGFVVEAGSADGEEVLARLSNWLHAVGDEILEEMNQQRERMVQSLERSTGDLPDAETFVTKLSGKEGHVSWEAWAAKCVECGACTSVCPTCHCYYLLDTPISPAAEKAGAFVKVRTWDSCLFAEYARMAGMGFKLTPRPRLRSRLSNRVLHKYVYSFDQYGMCGCLGCGRCDEACLGGIDLREMIAAVGETT